MSAEIYDHFSFWPNPYRSKPSEYHMITGCNKTSGMRKSFSYIYVFNLLNKAVNTVSMTNRLNKDPKVGQNTDFFKTNKLMLSLT